MQLDLATIQLISNVVMITAVTTLAVICYLLRRDNRRLALELNARHEQAAMVTQQIPRATFTLEQVWDAPAEPESVAALHALPVIHPDIRQFVARRAQDWTVPSAADAARFRGAREDAPSWDVQMGRGLYS